MSVSWCWKHPYYTNCEPHDLNVGFAERFRSILLGDMQPLGSRVISSCVFLKCAVVVRKFDMFTTGSRKGKKPCPVSLLIYKRSLPAEISELSGSIVGVGKRKEPCITRRKPQL